MSLTTLCFQAGKKFEKCLNFIDDVLETPVQRLNLTEDQGEQASKVMEKMKQLR